MLLTACATPNEGNISVDWGNTQAHKKAEKTKVSKKNGPPSHAPAHGYRAKHSYRYYRNEHTYYDTNRKLYFYLDGGGWRIAVSLPSHIKLSNDFVTVELETDKPYEHYEEHTVKYPPGQMKKWKNKKGKKWAKN
jgi:hypothetical protein